MVSQKPTDVMHLVDLEVTKAIIKSILMKKVVNNFYRQLFGSRGGVQYNNYVASLSREYATYNKYSPSVFARRPRQLEECTKFKATEFRQFFLYTGPVTLKSFLSPAEYANFLCLRLEYRTLFSPDHNIEDR